MTTILGGNIQAKSKLGEGSTFTISLPTKWHEDVLIAEKYSFDNTSKMSPSKMILVVDDNPINIKGISKYLNEAGFKTISAQSGKEALILAERYQPFAITMDIIMPDLDGIEAAREIARLSPRPIVFLSGHFDQELLEGIVAAGGLAYLLKPVTADQLQAAFSLATKRFVEMSELREQVSKLEEALEIRKLISQAKGLLMERYGITEEEAHRRLQREASRSSRKTVDIARAIITAESVAS